MVNPGMANFTLGTVEQQINAPDGYLTSLGALRIPTIDPSEPFRRIATGDAQAVLAGGNLTLDLSQAQLTFPDGPAEGDVHSQLLSLNGVGYAALPWSMPHFAYVTNPAGVEVSGPISATLSLPSQGGSYDYVDALPDLVLMVGLDPNALILAPVGVGRVDQGNQEIISEGAIALQRLDYIGCVVLPGWQELLQGFVNGEVSLNQLTSRLQEGQ